MAKKKSNIDEKAAETPLSSMIDVVFLLLIYFIITQKPIVEDVHLGVDLPAPNGGKGEPPQLIKIEVHKLLEDDGKKTFYYLNGSPYEAGLLKEYLKSTADTNPDTTIMISCGPNAKHEKLIRLLDMCGEVGLTKLNLIDDGTVEFVPDKPEKR